MQIIQSIREKGAAIVIVVIALSLIGFILMDAKQGNNRLFGSMSTSVGSVDGDKIELAEFNKRVKQAEDQQTQRTGQAPNSTQTYQIREQMWNQVVAEKVFFAEVKKLGIELTAKELSYILLSNEPSNPLLQEQGLRDSITGKLDLKKAQAALKNIQKLKGEQREGVNTQIVDPLKISTAVSKYTGLLNASAYYPTWMQERETSDKLQFANISFATVSYNEISDSTIKVSDEEVVDYVSKNKLLFKQEAGRNLSYITFSLLPSSEDSAVAQSQLTALKASFTTDTNAVAFVARNVSSIEFTDQYLPKEKLNTSIPDSLIKLSPGTVFGPYVDKQNYVLAKMIGTKQLPDSVQARHILIGTNDPRTGQPIASEEVAKKLADSIYKAITTGADFSELAKRYSTDASNKDKGGDLGTFGYGTMVPEFNDFCFSKSTGTKGVVKTQFGYHVVDIIKQINFKPAYKIAFVAKEIIPSDATVNKASLSATKASAEKTKDRLEKYAAKNGLSLTSVPNLIKENDFSVGALQDARGLVRWAFEASVGEVSEPFSIGEQFIVATLDKVNEEGTQDAATARSGCEATIRNKKKAEIIIKKLGDQPTLEKVASIYKKPIQTAGQDSTLTFTAQIVNGVGVEPKLIGASFNKEFQNKVSPVIEGTTGVFLVKVNSIQSKAAETPDAIVQNEATRKTAIRNQTNGWFEGLKKQANIKDNRSKHF